MADEIYQSTFTFRHRRPSDLLAPFMDSTNTEPEPCSWQLPCSPADRNVYQRLLNEELAQNDEREFGIKQEVKQSVFEEHVVDDSSMKTNSTTVKCEDDIDDEPGPSIRGGYMSKTSPFSLDHLTPDMSFLEWYPKGSGTVTYLNDLGDVESVNNLSPWIIEQRSFLLSEAFEYGPSGPRLHLEAVTPNTIRPFLQFLYTGAYILPTPSGEPFEDVPTSLLTHCQLYRLGDIYELKELKSLANVAIIRQCEFGCSSPEKPIDLCPAIEYVYKSMREHIGVIDTIINYCVTCFLTHGLGSDFEFRRMAFDLRPFHQDMCRVSMGRGFEDDNTAQAIIQMPFKPYVPDTYASREDFKCYSSTRFDDVYHFHGEDFSENSPKKRKRLDLAQGPGVSGIALALRQKMKEDTSIGLDNDDEELYSSVEKRTAPHSEPEIKDRMGNESGPFWEAASSLEPEGTAFSREQASRRNSDAEYEIIPGPALVEALSSDSESEAGTLVVANWSSAEEAEEASGVPIQTHVVASSSTAVERRRSSASDSDWDLV